MLKPLKRYIDRLLKNGGKCEPTRIHGQTIQYRNKYHAVLILLQRVSSTDKNNSFELAAVYLAEMVFIDPSK